MKKAFTLLEVLISITILSIIMIFLHKSYSSLNLSNKFYKKEVSYIKNEQLKRKTIFLDFSLALNIKILNQNTKTDIVFMQSSNSIYNRYNPYIAYIFKDKTLYRLELLKEFKNYPLDVDNQFSIESFGKVEKFRVYKSLNKNKNFYLINIDFKDNKKILLKIKQLNTL